MEKILTALFIMTMAGTVISLLLLALKPLSSRVFSATWQYVARLIVIVLFLLPFSLCLTSFRIDANHAADRMTELNVLNFAASNQGSTGTSDTQGAEIPGQETAGSDDPVKCDMNSLLFVAWVAGICVFCTFRLRDIFRFKRIMAGNTFLQSGPVYTLFEDCKLDLCIRRKARLAVNPAVHTPMLAGLMRPVVIIPDSDMRLEALIPIFKHELTHLARGDLWIKAAALAANGLHWFNPFSHMLVKSIHLLSELSCDESVVKNMGVRERKNYAAAILSVMERAVSIPDGLFSTLYTTRQNIERRLIHLMDYKRKSLKVLVFSLFSFIVLAATGAATATVSISEGPAPGSLTWPVSGEYEVVSGYGMRTNPITGKEGMHTGIDIMTKKGSPIYAVEAGRVVLAGWAGDYGNTVMIEHDDGAITLYAHCSALCVKVGDRVDVGWKIAEVGDTGMSTGPHLHLEIRINGDTVNPQDYLLKGE